MYYNVANSHQGTGAVPKRTEKFGTIINTFLSEPLCILEAGPDIIFIS